MLATGVGIRDSLTLADGSRVILGPLSSVKVGRDFETGARQVEVTGTPGSMWSTMNRGRSPCVLERYDRGR